MKRKIDILLLALFTSCGSLIAAPLTYNISSLNKAFYHVPNHEILLQNIIFTMPCLGFLSSCFIFGSIIDKWPKYKLFAILGSIISFLSGAEFIVFQNLNLTLYTRFFFGIGAAMLVSTAYSYARFILSNEERMGFSSTNFAINYILSTVIVISSYALGSISYLAPFYIYFIYLSYILIIPFTKISNEKNIPSIKSEDDKKNKLLIPLFVIYISAIINALIATCIESNTPFLVKEIGKESIFATFNGLFSIGFSFLFAVFFDKIFSFQNKILNFAICFLILSIGNFMLSNLGGSIVFIYLSTILQALPKTLVLIYSTRWYMSISTTKNIGKISSLFLTSMYLGCVTYSFINVHYIYNIAPLQKALVPSYSALIWSIVLFILSFRYKDYDKR
ncbi:MFS transporter [Candidatus Deianiraea vastatrix]|uniref:Major Facilitator Superfamily protein n=1 Tax=Candidatus Deianiraea vastatrix TaxID=2163644 RepID=A0A5B8XIB5_9RICK|nr:MFS transporter [Candidatus Deianiraea vastatrix]QED23751.1 Major Facilitator Superfamily protein [Candidatus Deianiraea vastatrix]